MGVNGSGKSGGALNGMPAGKRMSSEELVGELLAELAQGRLRQLVEDQRWCGACRELRTRAELEGLEREGEMIYTCLACGELVEALPF